MSDLSVNPFQSQVYDPSRQEDFFTPLDQPEPEQPFTPIDGLAQDRRPAFDESFEDGAVFYDPVQDTGEGGFDDGVLESVTSPFLSSVAQNGALKTADAAAQLAGHRYLQKKAESEFARLGEDALQAFKRLQEAPFAAGTASQALGNVMTLGQLDTGLDEVRDMARSGRTEEAVQHTFGTAAQVSAEFVSSLFTVPARFLGVGGLAKDFVKSIGISSAAYGAGSLFGRIIHDPMARVAGSLHDRYGIGVNPHVLERYREMQAAAR